MHPHGLDLAPFRALRYAPDRVGDLAAVTSPPYDVVVRPEGLRELRTAHPLNIVRLILPGAADGDRAADAPAEAARTLRRWVADGVLTRDPQPALYVYEQRTPGQGVLQRGVLGALRIGPRAAGVVLPHEDVAPAVVAERAALTRATAANLEPLLLAYRGPEGPGPSAGEVVERTADRARPLLTTTTEDGVTHRLWRVSAPAAVTAIHADLTRRRALIADGHHRWAASLALAAEHGGRAPWDRALALLVDGTRRPLRLRAIHRLVPALPAAAALARAAGAFRVTPLDRPLGDALAVLRATPGTAFLLAGGPVDRAPFHLLDRPDPALLDRTLPAGRPEEWRRLDATVLHATLLSALWGVPDDPSAVGFHHDATSAVAHARSGGGTAVLMRPVAEETVWSLAERGVTMPRKSTSFGPKPATGLLLRDLTDGSPPARPRIAPES
jgi:uncharacterized protein (DUF1015 family)